MPGFDQKMGVLAISVYAWSGRSHRKLLARSNVSNIVVSTQILQYSGPGLEGDGMSPIIGFDSFPRTRVVFGINSVDQLGELAR